MDEVAEEAATPEDEVGHARFAGQLQAARVAAGVEQADVPGAWRFRVDDGTGARAQAVRADEEVALGGRAVGERGPHAGRRDVGVLEAAAVLDGDAAPDRLVAQRLVEVGSRDRTGRHRHSGQFLAAADELHGRCLHAEIADRVLQVEDVERLQSIDGQGQERPDAVGAAAVRLVDDRVDPGALERHRRDRAAIPPPMISAFLVILYTIHTMTIGLSTR